ncbi:energy transducer TonB [Hymenobacter sp. 15J16-1T3B]|uniref:energy transducer TonB n=1 Tax=Hymenobacter sp. 15J16-1T3B TaxID=2886941 RepID=UPI001D1290C9|nr:energy transducer TonB [Hymenobacter sp. 15J16-1T3B]MCC3157851.1 energy transducer TonB [Hymenobacter sp. 15J16-1T3B]
MHFRILLAGLTLAAATAHAQTVPAGDTVRVGGKVYTYVEQMPQPPGGMPGLMQFLGSQLQYPAEAQQQRIEGKVFVTFVVNTEGRIEQARVSKGAHALLDAEALRVIQLMPAWTPGRQLGRPVNVAYTVPVNFRLPPAEPAAASPKYPFDVMAEPPGGMAGLMRTMAKTLRYPAEARAQGAQGRVFVQFVLDSTGQVQQPVVVKSVHPLLDAEAVRVIQTMPRWKPALYQGRPVPVSMTVPVTFGLPGR